MRLNVLLLAVAASLPTMASADGLLFGGQPRLTFEFESEKNTAAYGDTSNFAFSLFPGIQWKESDPARPLGFLTRAELMLEGNQDHLSFGTQKAGSDGKTTEVKLGARVRADGSFNGTWGWFARALVGQSLNNERNFSYWYVEPALKTKFNSDWSWTTSYRIVRTFSRDARDADRNKFRLGPNYDIDKNNGFEFRYVWVNDPNNGNALRARAVIVEYIHRF